MVSGTLSGMRCGVGDYTYQLCSELKRCSNVRLHVITSNNCDVKDIDGVEVRPFIKKWGFCALPTLVRAVKETDPDIVHIQYPTQAYKKGLMINLFPMIFKLMFQKVSMVVTVHDAKTAHALNKMRLLPLLLPADKTVVTAPEEERYLLKWFPFLKGKIEVIAIGPNIETKDFESEDRQKVRSGFGIAEEDVLISHFGYMLPKKRIEAILHALRQLLDEGFKARLVLISSFHPERDRYHARLKRIAERLDLGRVVLYTGYQQSEDVSRILSSSDICVQTYHDGVSFRRGSFIAVLCHGLPVVTTAVGRLPVGLENRKNLISIHPGDIGRLKEAVKELILRPELRKSLGRNGRLFSRRFSWKNIATENLTLYHDMLRCN